MGRKESDHRCVLVFFFANLCDLLARDCGQQPHNFFFPGRGWARRCAAHLDPATPIAPDPVQRVTAVQLPNGDRDHLRSTHERSDGVRAPDWRHQLRHLLPDDPLHVFPTAGGLWVPHEVSALTSWSLSGERQARNDVDPDGEHGPRYPGWGLGWGRSHRRRRSRGPWVHTSGP